jgi:alpha-tubulin suppressor-like RCC1 family protein
MFQTKTPVALLAGMAMAGAIVVAPGAFADPTAGRAAAWGDNFNGQLGNNSTVTSRVPVAVNTAGALVGRTVTAISAGFDHSCAVADGRVFCWGWNRYGQLGNDSTTDSSVPVAVNTAGALAGKTVTAISTGAYHSCAVADGRAFCWGGNHSGQLGNTTTTDSSVPVAVNISGALAGKTVTAMAAGLFHSCAVADGRGFCWGGNAYGQLGNTTTTTDSSVPVAVNISGALAGKTVTAVAAGNGHSCAVADDRAFCWGLNILGQLGNTTTINSTVPVAVNTSGPLAGRAVTAITGGAFHSCVVAEGRASCWGDNGAGQLGDSTTTDSSVPVPVNISGALAGKTVTGITAGGGHSCAVADGKAFCWGSNNYGQLGNNNTANSKVPIAVDTTGLLDGKTVTAVTAGGNHSVVLAAAVPQPPTAVTGVPGNGQATVSWTAPGDDGGSPVIDHTVTAIPGGASCTISSTSCVVSGLTNGTGYTFTVTARNAIGASTPSAPSAPVTPSAPVKQKQTATVKVPKKIKYKGKKVLLKKAVWTNAGQKAASKITVKPKAKKYAKVKTTKKGKVTIRTFGKKKLKVTLKLTAPATSEYTAYSYKKKWTVKKKRS